MANNLRYISGITALMFVLIMTRLTGCTHNNGDIGPWYGAWTLTSVQIDGNTDPDYKPCTIIWKFQSTVINMTEIGPVHEVKDYFGTWRQLSDTTLELNFTHSDNDSPSGTDLYVPAAATHLPAAVTVLQIKKFTSKHIVLTYTDPEGIVYTYFLDR